MTIATLYRTFTGRYLLAMALAALTLLAVSGCGAPTKQKTMKEEQYDKWNAARVGVLYQLAKQQYEVGDFDKCRETLTQTLHADPNHAGLHILAAKVDIEKGTLESASEHLKKAAAADPSNPEPPYLLGVVYQRWQKNEAALDYYQQAYSKKPNDPLNLLAVVEMKITLGQLDEAQKLLEEKAPYFEETAAIRVALAKLATLHGEKAAACKYLQQATLLSPDDLSIRQSYAEALYAAGRYGEAARALEELRKNPDLPAKDANTSMLGQCYMALKRPREARTCFAELTRNDPNDNAAWLNLGKATLQLDDYPQAAAVARKLLKTQPDNVPALVLLALAQEKLKQPIQAEGTLLRANKVAPGDTTVLCLLGLNAQAQGQKDRAAEYFGKAKEANPDDPWPQELLSGVQPEAHSEDR